MTISSNRHSHSMFLFEHDLFGKPVHFSGSCSSFVDACGAGGAPIREAHMTIRFSRRRFLSTSAGLFGTIAMPYLSRSADRPQITHGVQSGDMGADGGVVWARADRPSQMMVEVSTAESFANARALPPISALPESDFTAKMLLENLPAGQQIFYRVRFRDLSHPEILSEPVIGRFRTAPGDRRDVSFV